MKYSNPRPPEGVNVGDHRPAREFFILLGALLALVAVALVAVFQFSQWLAPWVPFAWERRVEAPFVSSLLGDGALQGDTQAALQRLTERVAAAMDLPPDVSVRVHYVKDPTFNAVATLGGNIVVYQGLVERLPNEDALAMVLAHEIAHVKHRDVLAAMGGGIFVSIAASLVLGDAGAAADLVGHEALLTMLHYSRAKESAADRAALAALVRLYGHGGGGEDLFDAFAEAEAKAGATRTSALLTSHPLTPNRFTALQTLARQNGWTMHGARTPLSEALTPD